MTQPSIYPSGPPLPPNRRVRRKSVPDLVQAPDERRSSHDLAEDAVGSDAALSPGRRRFVETLRLVAGLLVAILTALACVWGLVRYTRTSPRFAVRAIQIEGGARRSHDEIAHLAGLAVGQNIFSIDLESGRNAILGDPWIEKVTVTRKLPGTIQIDVVEREAAALVAVGSDLYLSTRQGELFKKPDDGDPFDLPVVTGCKPDDVAKDRAAAVLTIKRALDLVADYERTALARTLPVQEAHLDDDGALVLAVGKTPILLHMGKGPYRQALEQVTRVMNEIATRRAEASNVFVDNEAHPERVVVRMR